MKKIHYHIQRAEVRKFAVKAGLPTGWYQGPSFDEDGNLVTGIPECLMKFADLVVVSSMKTAMRGVNKKRVESV